MGGEDEKGGHEEKGDHQEKGGHEEKVSSLLGFRHQKFQILFST